MLQTASQTKEARAAYRALGTFRFILAFMVVLSHTWTFSAPGSFVHQIGIGNIAVMTFFILSGFIIAEAVEVFYAGRAGAFLANRALRLIPPYWGAVVISMVAHLLVWRFGELRLQDYDHPPIDVMFAWQNALVQLTAIIPIANFNNVFPPQEWYYFVRFSWAIFVEFAFYGAVAACMIGYVVGRRLWPGHIYCALCVFGAIAIHILSEYVRPLHSSFAYIPYFAFGVCAYAMITRGGWLAHLLGGLAFGVLVLHFSRYTQGRIVIDENWLYGLSKPTVWTPILLLAACSVAVFPLAKLSLSADGARVDRWLGDIAYPLYLNHYTIIILVLSTCGGGFVPHMVAIAASLALAGIMKVAIERPMTRTRTRIRGAALT